MGGSGGNDFLPTMASPWHISSSIVAMETDGDSVGDRSDCGKDEGR